MTPRETLVLLAALSLLLTSTFCVLGIWGALRMGRAAKRMAIQDRRLIAEHAHGELLRAAGVCTHTPGAAAIGCDCRMGYRW